MRLLFMVLPLFYGISLFSLLLRTLISSLSLSLTFSLLYSVSAVVFLRTCRFFSSLMLVLYVDLKSSLVEYGFSIVA